MVSPMHPAENHVVTGIALNWLDLPQDSDKIRSSVMGLPDDMGYAVTVVQYEGSLKVHLLHVDMDGNTVRFGGEA